MGNNVFKIPNFNAGQEVALFQENFVGLGIR